MQKIFRQGDVLIREVAAVKGDVKPIERENGNIVLAHGEVTGHSHAIASMEANFVVNEQALRYLEVKAPFVALRHEEHAEIKLPAGIYEVVIQREYRRGQLRNVAD